MSAILNFLDQRARQHDPHDGYPVFRPIWYRHHLLYVSGVMVNELDPILISRQFTL